MDVFKDKVAIVTGAASGIGRALSAEMTRRGAVVVMADVNAGQLAESASAITGAGGRATAAALDVTDAAAVKKLVDDTAAKHGRLDYMFNNAGIGVGGEAVDFALTDWRRVIEVNLFGAVHGVAAAYPLMVKQGFGHIVNTASLAGLTPAPGEISYTTSKYGIVGLSTSLRLEAETYGVKVSVVCPGLIATPIFDHVKLIKIDRALMLKTLGKGYPPDKCARVILKGVEKNRAIIVVTALAKALYAMQRLSPIITDFVWRQYLKEMRKARMD
jgi:NAD(P)-dependent dehydrogenase (short-subunit alcohol dehydrogenase family)